MEMKCSKCGSDDLQVGLNADGEADDGSPVICKSCGNQWTYAEQKQKIAELAKEEIKKMLGNFKL